MRRRLDGVGPADLGHAVVAREALQLEHLLCAEGEVAAAGHQLPEERRDQDLIGDLSLSIAADAAMWVLGFNADAPQSIIGTSRSVGVESWSSVRFCIPRPDKEGCFAL